MKRIFFPFRLPLNTTTLTAMSFRNKGHLLLQMLSKISIAISGKTREPVLRGTYVVIQRMLKIKKHQGLKGLTSFLKTCSVSTQQALGGHVHPNLTDLNTRVSRTKGGIPTVLPVLWRRDIFTKPLLARYILSIFAVYRFFLYESPVKIKAITSPFTGNEAFLSEMPKYIPLFFTGLRRRGAYPVWERPNLTGLFPILTQSPTSKGIGVWSSKRISVTRSWLLLNHDPQYKETWIGLQEIAKHFNVPLFFELFHSIARFLGKQDAKLIHGISFLGKLGLKQEAAGKMRVFAMVDPITQWVLYPIHRFIFDEILDKIPMDGTFNQTLPLEASRKWSEMYSLDLSSATDRLPIKIQQDIIEYMWPGLGVHWKNSLVERLYYNPDSKSGVKYSVGQPMGAYSSWAMLALTHHFIVQVAAWIACVVPHGVIFEDYAILGDDIVIGNRVVKDKYLYILNQLGVECGLHKSLLSPSGTALEFAKRTWHLGFDVSPITIKDLAASLCSVQSLVSFMRHHHVSLPNALKIAGFGYRVLGGLNKPFYKLNEIVRNTILTTIFPEDVDSAELFGRSSLTRYVWEPEIGNPILLKLLREMMSQTGNSLFQFISKPNPELKKDTAFFSIQVKQALAFKSLTERINQTVDALKNPTWVSMTSPIEVLKEYIYVLREAALIKGMSNTELAKAKFGVDPLNVKLWKQWNHVISNISKSTKVEEESKEIKFLESSFILPFTAILHPIKSVRAIRVVWSWSKSSRSFLSRGQYVRYLTIFYPFTSFILYMGEWIALFSGLTLTIVCLIVLMNPEFFIVTLVPQLLSVLGTAHTASLLGSLGIQHELPLTWLEWFSSFVPYITYPITGSVNILPKMADYMVSTIVWWNTFILSFIKGSIGVVGLWAVVKTLSLIKMIVTHTTAAMTVLGISHPAAVIGTFITQAMVLVFLDPIASLYNSFSLSGLVLFIVPDPLGIWNLLISINVLPWAFIQGLVHFTNGTLTSTIIETILIGWNYVLSDLTLWGLNVILHINDPHQVGLDFINFVIGPLDQRLVDIIREVNGLRGLWR